MLPPCGHACNAVVLVDQGLCAVPHAEPINQASDPPPLQPPGPHNHTHSDLGSTGQTSRPKQFASGQAASTTHCALDHTQTCLAELPNHRPLPGAHACGPLTATGPLSCEPDAAECDDTLYCGAGQADAFLALSFDQLLAVSKGRAVDLVRCGAPLPNEQGSSPVRLCKTVETESMFLLDSMCGRLCRWLRSA